MPFLITTKRKHTFNYSDEDGELTATFDFPTIEDAQVYKMADKLKNVSEDELKNDKNLLMTSTLCNIRSALIDFTGINDADTVTEEHPEGTPILLRDDKGNIIEDIQKAVFDFIFKRKGLKEQILAAYLGAKGKNLKTGATQQ